MAYCTFVASTKSSTKSISTRKSRVSFTAIHFRECTWMQRHQLLPYRLLPDNNSTYRRSTCFVHEYDRPMLLHMNTIGLFAYSSTMERSKMSITGDHWLLADSTKPPTSSSTIDRLVDSTKPPTSTLGHRPDWSCSPLRWPPFRRPCPDFRSKILMHHVWTNV